MELYQFAAAEHEQYASRAQRIGASLEEVNTQLVELERKYEEMKHKVKDMHIRRMEIMGRENATRANHRMNQVLDSNTDKALSFSGNRKLFRRIRASSKQFFLP